MFEYVFLIRVSGLTKRSQKQLYHTAPEIIIGLVCPSRFTLEFKRTAKI